MPPEARERGTREYTLPPGSYVYVQDGTNGRIKTHAGPTTVTLTNNDAPIVYDKGAFIVAPSLEEAVRRAVVAPEGFYIVLMNPATGDAHPMASEGKIGPDLMVGHKVIVQGPAMFALWPGQVAEVVRGHNLRSNQYLLCRVYNDEEARKNWKNAVVKPAEQVDGQAAPATPAANIPKDLTVGKLLVIKGTDVSFYIPPTGITVMKGEDGSYVREAVTLEQLEYCILVDESGKKRIPRGPAVVFPTPTEQFVRARDTKEMKFRAIELNPIQGIHVKVTQAYEDPVLGSLTEGQEVFITGKEYPIWIPREEHMLIRYDGKPITYAVAIPEGDGRYVLDRMEGVIRIEHGAKMLLPNPIHEVIVQRPLSDKECALWYPGNAAALAYNQALRAAADTVPTTRTGTVSEGDARRKGLMRSAGMSTSSAPMAFSNTGVEVGAMNLATGVTAAPTATKGIVAASYAGMDTGAQAGDEALRSSTYTAPRTLTLGSKFWVPKINVWTGYAIEVVNSKGNRKVVEGPAQVLLEYDETLESLAFSTGKPKTTDHLLETPYLLVKNNKVADIISVETSDFVELQIKVSYKVDFEGEPTKWFAVSNYIKFLCDYGRSALKAAARKMTVEDLYANYLEFVKKNVIGEDNTGHIFEENGMHLKEVEVLAVTIPNAMVAALLQNVQKEVVSQNLALSSARKKLETTKAQETIKLETAQVQAATSKAVTVLELDEITRQLSKTVAVAEAELAKVEEQRKIVAATIATEQAKLAASLDARKKTADVENQIEVENQELAIEMLNAESDALTKKLGALKDGLGEALMALSNNEVLTKVATSMNVQHILGGNLVDILGGIFKGSPFEGRLEKLMAAPLNGAAPSLAPKTS